MHQAVLAGTLLAALRPAEFQQFPFEVNYPLHLHSRITKERRVSKLSQLITCRTEELVDTMNDSSIQNLLKTDKPIMDWLQAHTV